MQEIDIGQVVRQSGIPASTLRYYESRGLIAPLGRNGLRRVYDASVMQRLALIALGRAAGFSLQEIGSMLGDDGVPVIDRPQLQRRADDLDRHIARLQALRDGLRHTAHCRHADHLQCPTFQRLMRSALRRQRREGDGRR
ncbi:helix-turn-helix domain-containing protein [Stenotrophomonas mori]|uniref:Helix-turn-helix domain-containing protein n=1 Tax=Stenotrophomonas mori TaxID=2871096 RepID=A0ABT0SJ68_9GAMM|nr:helix-turn-helix domain-containing protein [Stenotrophomonas mori]MCL7714979.1 helix-turn-helix domain-containing protein [Stenotrophomonas mori]